MQCGFLAVHCDIALQVRCNQRDCISADGQCDQRAENEQYEAEGPGRVGKPLLCIAVTVLPVLPATRRFKLVVPVQMRSKRNFCIDITLICILLALGLYLYMMFKNK